MPLTLALVITQTQTQITLTLTVALTHSQTILTLTLIVAQTLTLTLILTLTVEGRELDWDQIDARPGDSAHSTGERTCGACTIRVRVGVRVRVTGEPKHG